MAYGDRLRYLALELGEKLQCVSEDTNLFSEGTLYTVVEQDNKLGIVTDCGFFATSSWSRFKKLGI